MVESYFKGAVPGQTVFSKAGRDKGSAFVVVAIEGEYVYLTDGETRKVSKPKKKKIKHVLPVEYIDETVAEIIRAKGAAALNDEIVKAALRELKKGALFCRKTM